MSKVSSENLLLVGKVTRPHGLGGILRIFSYARSGDTFLSAGTVFLKSDKRDIFEFKVLSVKPHRNVFLMSLYGLNSLDEAEKYRGAEIFIRKDTLVTNNEDEYFWFELIGLKVYLNSGRYIGTLQDIINTNSNDIYVIREGESEFLIPAINEVVQEIDLENKKMIITDMEGLLDLNEI